MARPLACRSEVNGVKWLWNCLAELTTRLVSAPRPSRGREKGSSLNSAFLTPKALTSSVYVHVLEAPSPLKFSILVMSLFPYQMLDISNVPYSILSFSLLSQPQPHHRALPHDQLQAQTARPSSASRMPGSIRGFLNSASDSKASRRSRRAERHIIPEFVCYRMAVKWAGARSAQS